MFFLRVDEELALGLLPTSMAEEVFLITDESRVHLRRWLPWVDGCTCVEMSRAFLAAGLRQFGEENGFQAGIFCRGELCGVIGLHRIDRLNRSTSIGYWLAEPFVGRGIMTRACGAVVDHVFDELGLNRAEIRCAVGNARSRAIPERLGFLDEGTVRDAEWLYDHYVDHVVYGMLAGEWRERRGGR